MDDNPHKFKHILAMTFTNKAANEMKERILQKLIQLSKDPGEMSSEDSKELQKFAKDLAVSSEKLGERAGECLNQILHNYGMFAVMTIDKFTHRVIRTFAKELGLSLDFDVELDLDQLRANVADLLFDQIGRNKDITALMKHYATSNLEDDKSWNFRNNLVEFSKKLFNEDSIDAVKSLKDKDSTYFIDKRKEMVEENAKILAKLKALGKDGVELVKRNGLDHDDFYYKAKGVFTHFLRMADGDTKNRANSYVRKSLETGDWHNKSSSNVGVVQSISTDLEAICLAIENVWDNDLPTYNLNRELLKNINNLSLIGHLMNITDELKEQENVLLISDFYKKIAEIISNEPVPFIYERLGNKYDHFLLDEFQDTSHLQWVNLVPLLHNSLAIEKHNLIVGDGKQAIYRWRNGEVEQFIQLPEIYNPGNIESLNQAQSTFLNQQDKINLAQNYRSGTNIVAFNNAFFEKLVLSKSEKMKRIYFEGGQEATKDFEGYVEVFTPEDKDRMVQMEYAENVIRQSLSLGYKLSDICILVRRNKDGAELANYLSNKGIQLISQESLFVGKDRSVKFLFSLIKNEAYSKNRNNQKKCIEHFCMLFPGRFDTVDLVLSKKNVAEWFREQEFDIRSYREFNSFYEYVEQLITCFDLDVSSNVYLQFFLEQIHQFEKRKSNNLHAFISWFEEKGRTQSIKSPEGSDAVQVMTIHKSKGLQFPVVICAFFDWSTSSNKSEKWIMDPKQVIPAFPLTPSENTKQTQYGDKMELEEENHNLDHLNLLYVAFTRAECALFISSSSGRKPGLTKTWIKAPIDLITDLPLKQENDRLSLGSFKKEKESEAATSIPFEATFLKQVMNKPAISTKSGDQWDYHELDDSRAYGTQLHLLLSQINSLDDVQDAAERLAQKGEFDHDRKAVLITHVTHLFKHEHFATYFQHENVQNERPIIDSEGNKFIPDKVIELNDHLLVVDFKTGEGKSSNHTTQVQNYMDLLAEVSGKDVKGELYYTEDQTVLNI